MKIRLILPICNELKINEKKYCNDSLNINKRLEILQNSINYKSNDIDLVVTSNNFFESNKVTSKVIQNKLNKLSNKRNLLLGIDFPKIRNPFNGIPAKVFYFNVVNNNYKLKNEIWEVWNSNFKKNNATLNAFKKQNRLISVNSKIITMLSCGDILSSVHQSGKELSTSDIYIDLAHLDFSNYLINKNNNLSWIQYWKGKDKIVLVSQQLTKMKLKQKNFFENNKYKLIYPTDLNQTIYYFDSYCKEIQNENNANYILVDVEIANDKF